MTPGPQYGLKISWKVQGAKLIHDIYLGLLLPFIQWQLEIYLKTPRGYSLGNHSYMCLIYSQNLITAWCLEGTMRLSNDLLRKFFNFHKCLISVGLIMETVYGVRKTVVGLPAKSTKHSSSSCNENMEINTHHIRACRTALTSRPFS